MACEDCAKPAAEVRGDFWAGEPSGKEVKIHGMDAYIAEPASPTGKAVLLIPDVYGAAPPCQTGPPSAAHRCCLPSAAHTPLCQDWYCRNML